MPKWFFSSFSYFKTSSSYPKALYDYLVKEYGKENVGTENLTPIGTEIDIVAKHGDEYDLYEIKTISDIRLCIRESLSQLLEYGLYHTDIKVRNYYIVGSIVLTDDAQKYLNALRKSIIFRLIIFRLILKTKYMNIN